MPTVDVLLYLTETPRHAPTWWMDEMYRPYGGEYGTTDGAALVLLLDAAGIDVGLAHGSDIRRTTYHPDHPDLHEVHVPNEYTAESSVPRFPGASTALRAWMRYAMSRRQSKKSNAVLASTAFGL